MALATSSKKLRRDKIYLIGTYEDDIKGSKLPSNKQTLAYFMYLHIQKKETICQAATHTIDKIASFWDKAKIPIRHKQDCVKKIKGIFARWQALKKNSSRQSQTQKQNEEAFTATFDDLFDVAHADALVLMKIEKDRQFLLAQREKERRGSMMSVDRVLLHKERKHRERIEKEKKRRLAAAKQAEKLEIVGCLDSSSTDNEEDTIDEYEPVAGPSSATSPTRQKRGRKAVVTPKLAASLDRNQISDRAATMICGESAISLGHNISDLALNRSSIRRQRIKTREITAAKLIQSFNRDAAFVVHWDGKLLPDLTGNEKIDRLPILVSNYGSSQLLAVPKLKSGTGDAQARAILNTLEHWHIEDKVQGLCFDTTSSNTGLKKGACKILEQLLGRDLLHFACRHHIMEIIAGSAFIEAMGAFSAPEFLLFKRFQAKWGSINQKNFKDSSSDEYTKQSVADVQEVMIHFLETSLKEHQPRSDYRELLELTMVFLGASHPLGTRFRAPGAMHQARWMAKAIYTFKVWMFRSQFKLKAAEEHGLRDLCIFFSRIYVKAWITAPQAIGAPASDLALLQALDNYRSIHAGISNVTMKKLGSHLWYLSEKLVGLAFFDEHLEDDLKDRMVHAMSTVEGKKDPPNRISIPKDELQGKTVVDFLTTNSRSLFHQLKISESFLKFPAASWKDNESYRTARAIAEKVAVTNDHAERGVALVKEYSGRLTKDEEQLQFLLQVVADHRKRFPDALKRTLTGQQ